MQVTNSRIRRYLPVTPRTPRMIESIRSQLFNNLRQKLFVNISSRKIRLQPILRILILKVVCKSILLLDLIVFVIPDINYYRRVMTQSGDVVDCFSSD